MENRYSKLFQPTYIGKLKIKNKISMAPMGPIGFADDNGAFNQRGQDYYVERAKGGVGLIITGICSVDLEVEDMTKPVIPCPTINPLAFIYAGTQMNERIHAYGAKIIMQLTGGLGRSAIPGFVGKHIAPSKQENRWEPAIIHREMTVEEIQEVINKFAIAASVAKAAGFDGVEVHAVHEGYLLDQFAISFFNKRTDDYGGSLENRLRFATEIVKAIKGVCGADYPVTLRYSLKSFMKGLRQGALPGEKFAEVGKDTAEGIAAAKLLAAAGYDALNVDAGTYDSWYWNHPPMYFKEGGMYREFGRILKHQVSVPIILAGRMDDPDMACAAIGDSCDIVSYGRPLLSDPDYPEKVRQGRLDEIRPCLSCHEGCLGRISHGPLCCAVNPEVGREKIYGIEPAKQKKNVLVIGGGLAGMEVARVCAIRGHNVTLCEKSDKLGGNLIPGSVPDFKINDKKLLAWYERQLELLQVMVKKNITMNKERIEIQGDEIVVVATGSQPIAGNFGNEREMITASEALLGTKPVGQKVLIIGGGLVGCETGLWLAQQGKDVTIVEMAPDIAGGPHGMPFMNYDMLKDELTYHQVEIYKSTQVSSVEKDLITLVTQDGEVKLLADTVIIAIGYRAENHLYKQINVDSKVPVYNIGDSRHVNNIMYAIWDAYEIAREL
ncbi:FAD-dependent oxidoreductase [Acetobacterium paludosum]|uniref:FAD-dependent oxidoreductase n=1 Tax=Acetobacterium paludosum TaxID=52693 RepID=A0A923I3E0_9FIRM|nr:FAD-dependent oxidoreductase [Acetobacterium paludosum]MBC3889228.1 FAD-dependent oxidoreductase [Acetobacterium paludosum]